jgi:hypothetical protein
MTVRIGRPINRPRFLATAAASTALTTSGGSANPLQAKIG